ncbi:hypothetical protein [Oryzihumus leptocrescens]|uniref:Uncharacterized protein n=1 Tax=Oryzihumus leptocrescens TaxID=297536 RepID=A0A542ZIB3_9MICO|nr:hypothetical protein [Oryzihumus leptocrescens]TQL60087.1 hypothetical protein FB474_1464 [Oryzihumus leptocrescens]
MDFDDTRTVWYTILVSGPTMARRALHLAIRSEGVLDVLLPSVLTELADAGITIDALTREKLIRREAELADFQTEVFRKPKLLSHGNADADDRLIIEMAGGPEEHPELLACAWSQRWPELTWDCLIRTQLDYLDVSYLRAIGGELLVNEELDADHELFAYVDRS